LTRREHVKLRDVEKMESTLAKQLMREGLQPEAVDADWDKRKVPVTGTRDLILCFLSRSIPF